MSTRRTLANPGGARWMFGMLAIPAIVAGILAMHFLTGLSATSQQPHLMAADAVVVSVAHPMDDAAPDPAAAGCSVDCTPEHPMAAMACLLLAVFASVLLALAARSSHAWASPRDILARISVAAAALAPPRPPSLAVLCISRT